MQVFLEKGYKGASMQRIAEQAEVSKRTLYKHFPTKDAVLSEVLGLFMEQGTKAATVPFDAKQPLDCQFKALLKSKIKLLQSDNYRGLLKILLPEALLQSQRGDYLTRHFPYTQGPLVNWLSAAEKANVIATEDLMVLALTIQGALEKQVLWPQLMHGQDDVDEQKEDRIIAELTQLLVTLYSTDKAIVTASMPPLAG